MQVPSSSSYTAKGFFRSLFDVSFSSLIISRIIKVVYVLAMVLIGLEALGIFISALASKRIAAIIAAVVLIPIVSILSLIWIRILLELVIIIFRIGEDVRRISLSPQFNDASWQTAVGTADPVWSRAEPNGGAGTTGLAMSTTGMTANAQVDQEPRVAPDHSGEESSGASGQEKAQSGDLPAAGWYLDPQQEGYARFWSGRSWTDERRQIDL